jgi:hypothetical protein
VVPYFSHNPLLITAGPSRARAPPVAAVVCRRRRTRVTSTPGTVALWPHAPPRQHFSVSWDAAGGSTMRSRCWTKWLDEASSWMSSHTPLSSQRTVARRIIRVQKLFDDIIASGRRPDATTYTMLIIGYCI